MDHDEADRSSAAGRAFLHTYPGHSELPAWAPVGFPAWLEWQHFLSAFFILLIVRTGWQIRTIRRPPWRAQTARKSRRCAAARA